MKVTGLLAIASLALALPTKRPRPYEDEETEWKHLPKGARYEVLSRFSPNELAKISMASKNEGQLVTDHLVQERKLDKGQQRAMALEAARTRNTALFKLSLQQNGTDFSDDSVLLAACENGSTHIAKLFFQPKPMAKVLFHPMETLKEDCLVKASTNGHLAFIKETALDKDLGDSEMLKASKEALMNGHLDVSLHFNALVSEPMKREANLQSFLVASCTGNVPVMESLISGPTAPLRKEDLANSNFGNFYDFRMKQMPLHCASYMNHTDAVRFLLDLKQEGAPIQTNSDDDENWPFKYALSNANREVVEMLSVHSDSDPWKQPTLILYDAVISGDVEMIKYVLKQFEDRKMTLEGMDAISLKNGAPTVEVLQFLIDRFGDQLHSNGLYFAAMNGRTEILAFYASSPWINSFPDSVYKMGLFEATKHGHVEIVSFLRSRFSQKLDASDLDHALSLATTAGQAECIKALTLNRSDLQLTNDHLLSAIMSGNTAAVQVLIELGSPQFDPAADDNNALIDSASMGSLEMVKYLISLHSKYPKINPAAQKNRAFISAISWKNLKVAQYLVSIRNQFPGINPADQDNLALKSALMTRQSHVVDYLLSLPKEMGIDHSLVN